MPTTLLTADSLSIRLLRTCVVALLVAVPLSGDVLDELSRGNRILASAGLWSLWAVLLLSILVPSSATLTAIRLAAPAHVAISLLVSITAGIDAGSAIALSLSAITAVLTMSGDVGAHFIQSSAYGDERRFPLRCPSPFLAVIVIAWMLWFTAAVLGAVLLVAGTLSGIGIAFALVAVAGFVLLPRRFHRYSRRWLVKVPAGLVVHDHVILTETAMFSRRSVTSIDAWSSTNDSDDEADAPFDLSGGTRSSGIVIRLADPETVILAPSKGHPGGRAFHIRSARICPTRIGRTLRSLNATN